jgi:hypothetical protein
LSAIQTVKKWLKERRDELVARARRLPEQIRGMTRYDVASAVTAVLLVTITSLWLRSWYHGNEPILTDPYLQPDDARTAIFPFHRYSDGAPLSDDPIANEMLEYQPYAYRLLFRVTVPFVGLLMATKYVQALLIFMVVAAGIVLVQSRRAGLAAGVLFVFVFLHDTSVQDRICGGLPRGFGFPLLALWLSGALADRPWVRRSAAALGALTYPSGLALVLGAEGVYSLRGLGRVGKWTLLRRLKHYAILLAACVALLAPAVLVGMSSGGPIHTLEQAEKEPAFGRTGRLRVLPFPDPAEEFGKAYLGAFEQKGPSPYEGFRDVVKKHAAELAIAATALFIALPLLRLTPLPLPATACLISSLTLYAIARGFAFKLYSPERYYLIGMRTVALALLVGGIGLLAPRVAPRLRTPIRNAAAALVIFLMWAGLGNGVRIPQMGYDIDYRSDQPLWEFIQKLPIDTRFGCHIGDCDSIPLFTARANMGGFETLQPWLTESWARQKERTHDTFRAMYAESEDDVLAYAKKYKITHLMVNKNRYESDFVAKARTFEPFSSFTKELLSDTDRANLVLRNVPAEAIIHRYKQFAIVSVDLLEKAWAKQ